MVRCLRRALAAPARRPYKLKLRGWSAELQPGVDITDRDKLYEILEGRSG